MLGRDRELERVWRRRVRAQRTSGLTVRAFCEWEGLPESAFYFWRRELQRRNAELHPADDTGRQRKRPSASARPRFVPVVVERPEAPVAPSVSQSVAAPVIELVHPGGIVVRVAAGSEAAALRTILGVLDDRVAETRRC